MDQNEEIKMGNKTTVILIVIILVLSIALVGLLSFAASLDDEKYILKLMVIIKFMIIIMP